MSLCDNLLCFNSKSLHLIVKLELSIIHLQFFTRFWAHYLHSISSQQYPFNAQGPYVAAQHSSST